MRGRRVTRAMAPAMRRTQREKEARRSRPCGSCSSSDRQDRPVGRTSRDNRVGHGVRGCRPRSLRERRVNGDEALRLGRMPRTMPSAPTGQAVTLGAPWPEQPRERERRGARSASSPTDRRPHRGPPDAGLVLHASAGRCGLRECPRHIQLPLRCIGGPRAGLSSAATILGRCEREIVMKSADSAFEGLD
jgi:hypothetical protein